MRRFSWYDSVLLPIAHLIASIPARHGVKPYSWVPPMKVPAIPATALVKRQGAGAEERRSQDAISPIPENVKWREATPFV